jgi:hypothetical protein
MLMNIFATAWLWIESHSAADSEHCLATVAQIPVGTNVVATISLSYITFGTTQDTPGAVGAAIRSWEVFNADGSTTSVVPSPDFKNNSVFIENCASVTFELAGNLAMAYAQATLFTL